VSAAGPGRARRALHARGAAVARGMATEHAWMMAWMWVGYPPPVLWAASRMPEACREARSSGGSSATTSPASPTS